MQELEFRNWLKNKLTQHAINDYVSRCKYIEKNFNIDLDEEYKQDKGEAFLKIISYGKPSMLAGKKPPNDLQFDEGINVPHLFCNLRSSANKYFLFKSEGAK